MRKQKEVVNAATLLMLLLSPTVSHANPVHDQLYAMSESARANALTKFIKASGQSCGAVTRTFFQGSTKADDAVWHFACSNGEAYVFVIKNDREGSTQILNCKVLKAAGGGKCFQK